jgi:hypothetical protein
MRATKKSLTEHTLDNLLVPNKHYNYFECRHDHPFRYQSNNFEMVNAWWLVEAAFLAYAEPPFAEPRFQDAGLSNVKFFSGNSTQCYVAHNDDFIIVAFRGSEVDKRADANGCDIRHIVADWRVDLDTDLVDSGQEGSVHRGFKEALEKVWNPQGLADEGKALKPYLDAISSKDGRRRSVWFTGHSLGGALATLAADGYARGAGLYTFGSPRVGDRTFADHFRVNAYRFVNNDDVVTKVPLPGSYRHVGNVKYIDSEGVILDDPSFLVRLKANFRRVVRNTFNLGFLRLRRVLPKNALVDHAPIYYAIHIWNNRVR